MEFEIVKKSKKSRARLGFLKTEHGIVETPALVTVATQAVVKAMTGDEAAAMGSQLLICNTFHLHLKPGEKIIKSHGGLHKFMNWSRPLMTDSAGYQVFSLGFGRDHGVGKMLKEKSDQSIEIGQQPNKVKITENGVFFNSPVDGKRLFIGPKESIKIQEDLGADIILAFDECTSPLADYEYTKKSLERTHNWAKVCLDISKRTKSQALFGIVQGGKFKDLRIESAKFIGSLPFDGFGIGGEFGDDKKIMTEMLDWVMPELPEGKPRHLLGIGHPEDIIKIVKSGVDTFDCIAPTHYARRGVAFVPSGKLDLNKTIFLKDKKPVDPNCGCPTCTNFSRAYICHLLKAHEITPLRLLTLHNLYYFNKLVAEAREGIKNGRI